MPEHWSNFIQISSLHWSEIRANHFNSEKSDRAYPWVRFDLNPTAASSYFVAGWPLQSSERPRGTILCVMSSTLLPHPIRVKPQRYLESEKKAIKMRLCK